MKKGFCFLLGITLVSTGYSQNVGIGTTTPRARLHVTDSNVVFTAGNPFLAVTGNVPVSGAGSRMLWYADKASFRSGYIDGTQWDKDSIGYFSFGAGYNAKAMNNYSTATGQNTTAYGITATATGYYTTAWGNNSFTTGAYSNAIGNESSALNSNTIASGFAATALGFGSQASGNMSLAMGNVTLAKGDASVTMGSNTKARSANSLVIGLFNDTSATNRLFEIGNGTAEFARSNALTVLNNGAMGLGTAVPNNSAILEINSSTKGVLFPRMTTAQRNAIVSPANGLIIYNLDDDCTDIFDGANWMKNCGYKQNGTENMQAGNWSPIANFSGATRLGATGIAIGSKGYVISGSFNSSFYNDVWEYDPATNAWAQKANFPGPARNSGTGFVSGSKGYFGTGLSSVGNNTNDFWEYTPATNTWVQKADFPGAARRGAGAFAIGTKGYLGAGYNGTNAVNDFWEYTPATNTWVQKANFGGAGRSQLTSYASPTKGYFGLGLSDASSTLGDFWEYDPASNTWTQKANFGGGGRRFAIGFSIGTLGYIGAGEGQNDFWEYNPSTNIWTQKFNIPGNPKSWATGFAIGTSGYIGGGIFGLDFWKYNTQPISVPAYSDNNLPAGISVSNGVWKRVGEDVFEVTQGNVYINRYLGIGNTAAAYPLHFATAVGDKIALYGNPGVHYGLGIQGSLLQIHADVATSDIAFGYGSSSAFTETMRVKGNGNVGIGTSAPNGQLQFSNTAASRKLVLFETANNDYQFYGMGISGGMLRYEVDGITSQHAFFSGVNASTSQYCFAIHGDGNIFAPGTFTSTSDERLKKNIAPLGSSLSKITQLNGYTYNWISPTRDQRQQIGLIAQEVQKLYPQLVTEFKVDKEEATLGINYIGLIPVLIEGMKEQQQQIEQLQKQVHALEQLVEQSIKK
jgi:Chaperone of endosialidase/Galactose oxidase, central domain